MTIEIQISGYGNEVVYGNISKELTKKIEEDMKSKDIEELDQYFYDDENPFSVGGNAWFENDNLLHAYGPNDESEITITDEDGDELFSGNITELVDEAEYVCEEKTFEPSKGVNLFYGNAMEEGSWYAEIEIADDEEFDISKLSIRELTHTNDDDSGMIFDKLTYGGEDCDLDLDSSMGDGRITKILTKGD